jgi:hypothetical protein
VTDKLRSYGAAKRHAAFVIWREVVDVA